MASKGKPRLGADGRWRDPSGRFTSPPKRKLRKPRAYGLDYAARKLEDLFGAGWVASVFGEGKSPEGTELAAELILEDTRSPGSWDMDTQTAADLLETWISFKTVRKALEVYNLVHIAARLYQEKDDGSFWTSLSMALDGVASTDDAIIALGEGWPENYPPIITTLDWRMLEEASRTKLLEKNRMMERILRGGRRGE